tara:strand:- start:49 stop:921 length:873 start_codon:yes stop_codon:yes gene_type:complete
MKLDNLKPLLNACKLGDNQAAIDEINSLLLDEDKPGWIKELVKLKAFLTTGDVQFSVFIKDGNIKQPFLSFSGLPGTGFCPGSGDCVNFCYSFRAWRYPAAFCRQVQNTFLLNSENGQAAILSALDNILATRKFQKMDRVDFRLYVDGDFRSVEDIHFWMEALRNRPKIACYGYSKSFLELLGYDTALDITGDVWPGNYLLNVSGGHRHAKSIVDHVKRLPITRGSFVAVPVGHKVTSKDHGTSEHNKVLRAAYAGKAFTCPGKCGTCTPSGHACGSDRFRDLDIIIAIH